MTIQNKPSPRTARPASNAAATRNTKVMLAIITGTVSRKSFQRANAGTVGHCEFEAALSRRCVSRGAEWSA
jgi:hypothetical protein